MGRWSHHLSCPLYPRGLELALATNMRKRMYQHTGIPVLQPHERTVRVEFRQVPYEGEEWIGHLIDEMMMLMNV